MTELTITPKTADKTARFRGAVAAGEHVAVTIKGGAAWLGDDNGEHLSLRVLDLVTGRTLAVFPRPPETLDEGEEQDEWDTAGEDDTDLFCNLNLNTDRMVNAARHMLRVPVLFVLGEKDDEDASVVRTLYFRDRYIVEYWPERIGDDTPYDLDKWPRQIDEWSQLVADWSARLNRMKLAAQRSTDEPPPADVPYTTITLNSGADGETDTVVKVYDGQNGKDGKDGRDGQTTHEWVEERFLALAGGTMAGDIVFSVSSGQQSITAGSGGVIVTDGAQGYEFTRSGNVAGPGTVARLSDVATRYEKPQGGIPASDLAGDIPETALATAVRTSLGKADTALQASDITGKADKTTTYTKAEVDAIVAALKTGSRQIVASLSDVTSPQPLVIYMVAKSESQTSNAYDEFIWVDVNGVGRWEKIGDTEIDLSGYAKTTDLAAKQDVIADLAAIRSGAAAGATALQDAPTATETLAAEEYSSPDNSVTVDTPSRRDVKLKIRNLLSNTVNTLDTSASGTIATREWVQQEIDVPSPSDADPAPNGTAWEGESGNYSRADHVHPTDTSKLSIAGGTRTVTAEDSGGTESYKFAGTGEVGNANAIARIKELPYVNVGEAEEMLVGVYAISSRGVQRHTATSGETSATFGFADTPGTGKIADAILDIDNSGNTSALGMEFYGLGTTFKLVPPDGDDLAEMTSVDGGKRARFYFTETALVSNGLPVISIQRITLGAVATAIARGS